MAMKKVVGIVLIFIMFLSSIAFAAIGYVSGPQQQPAVQTEALPSQTIIDYRLSPVQLNVAMQSGLTVATYRYPLDCDRCFEERQFLESLVQSDDFQGQIILEEVQEGSESGLDIVSYVGSTSVSNMTSDSMQRGFCEVVVNQPLWCVQLGNA